MTQWLPHASPSPQALPCRVWTESRGQCDRSTHRRQHPPAMLHPVLMLQMIEGKGRASSPGPTRPSFRPQLQHRQGLQKRKVGATGLPRPVLRPAQGWGAAGVPSTVNSHRGTNAHLQLSFSNHIRFHQASFTRSRLTPSTHMVPAGRPMSPQTVPFPGKPRGSILFNFPYLITRVKFSYKH